VRAYNAGGDSGYSNTANAQTAACSTPPPAAPSNLIVTAASSTQINLTWTDNSNNETNFQIERSPDGTNGWTPLGTVGANVMSYANSSLTCGTTYYYRVQAFNTSGNSAYSNVASAQPTCTPTGVIFADGFETYDLSKWSACVTDGGDLSVSPGAKLQGNYGLQALLDDNIAIYCTDETPNAEPRYWMRFSFDPNTIKMKSGDAHYLFYGYHNTIVALRVEFRFSSGKYQVRADLVNDSTSWKATSWVTISDAPHTIALDWKASATTTAKNGYLTLWIDGAQKANLTKIDNDTRRIDRIRLGAVEKIDTGTRGTYFFDAFESQREIPISSATETALAQNAPLTDTVVSATEGEETWSVILERSALTVELAPAPSSASDQLDLDWAEDSTAYPAPAGFTFVGEVFQLELNADDGESLLAPLATLLIDASSLRDSEIRLPSDLALYQWQAGTQIWESLPGVFDVETGLLLVTIQQPGIFAVLQPTTALPNQLYLPLVQR
jgi:hypothetical protein